MKAIFFTDIISAFIYVANARYWEAFNSIKQDKGEILRSNTVIQSHSVSDLFISQN